jgi:hypothetical protein
LVLSNALGAPDGKFLSLGFLGEAAFSFGQQFTLPGAVFEITYGNRTNYLESVDVYAGYEGVFSFVVSLTNSADGALSFNYSGVFDQLKFADTSPRASERDGFDIDAVSVTTLAPTPVPLPAGGLMLLAALGAVGMLGRRRS